LDGYRVDRREFAPEARIECAGDYFKSLTDAGKIVEQSLESNRPKGKPKRNEVLHIFESLEPAKKFWSKMKDGKLYKVRTDDKQVCHIGDMQLTEKLHDIVKKNGDHKPVAESYWEGERTESPEIELLVNYAIVTEVISNNDDERRAFFKEQVYRKLFPKE
jgi:hypothetical protein